MEAHVVHVAAAKGGVTVSKETNMSMLNNTSSTFVTTSAILSTFRSWRAWLGRTINGCIARLIARREQQANLVILRSLGDRELMDIGVNRNQIGDGLVEAARERSALQEVRQRQSMMS
jgi:uncharacterized protein YjiS (DUF1127 family)